MTPEYAEILRLLDAKHAACDVARARRTLATQRAIRAAVSRLQAARVAVRDAFAAQYGMAYSERPFTLHQLSRNTNQWTRNDDGNPQDSPMDHVERFRLANRPYRPAAIISHEYKPFESGNALALARQYGLTAILLPCSWYWPGHANGVLYMGTDILCL